MGVNQADMQITKEDEEINKSLLNFIEKSPSVFHGVAESCRRLRAEGYEALSELDAWDLRRGGKYFVTKNDSALLAFRIPEKEFQGFHIMASHSDSPTFKIKENPEIGVEGHYVKLNVEKYGGMLMAPWFDRPLSVAGRIILQTEEGMTSQLVSVDRDLCLIPNLAIHMNRSANDGYKYNVQKDLLPLYACGESKDHKFMDLIADAAGVRKEEILGSDLFLYNRMKGSMWGADGEFISSGRLDDLQCAYASLEGFLASEAQEYIPVHVVFDNEEVGSGTKQGAASTFLADSLLRICEEFGISAGQYRRLLAGSFMLSADNAHGLHPNYPEMTCPSNRPYLNGGVVMKFSANQKYTTDGMSAAIFKSLCKKAGIPYQIFHNRSDMLGGSTLGNLSALQVAVRTVDIGLAQLAMHSPYETAGAKDTAYLIRLAKEFFSSEKL